MRSPMIRLLFAVLLSLGFLITKSLSYDDISDPDRDPETLIASELFDMIPAGMPGSCADRPVDGALRDAAKLADNGTAVLEKFAYNVMEDDKGGQGERYANMAYTVFGANYHSEEDLTSEEDKSNLVINKGEDRVYEAWDHFKTVQLKLKNRRQGKLMCGDKDLKLVQTLGDLGLEPKEQLISKIRREGYKGYFLSRYWSRKNSNGAYILEKALLIGMKKDEYDSLKNGVCSGSVVGSMNRRNDLMILCDSVWDFPTLQKTIDRQDSLKRLPIQDSKGRWLIDKQRTTGHIFLHEAFHWISSSIIDVKVDKTPVIQFQKCFSLSKEDLRQKDPCALGSTVRNADSHALFASGVTLKKVNWYPDGYLENMHTKPKGRR